MDKKKKVLVVAAHPDDEVYGMGGTIAKMVASGKEVHVLIVTDGSSAQYRDVIELSSIIERKKQETIAAAHLLGISSVRYGNMPDMKLDQTSHISVNQVIEDTIDMIKPEILFTHFWGDVNLDHQCVYKSTLVAVRPAPSQTVRELYCYSVPSSTEWAPYTAANVFLPNMFIDISGFTQLKESAINAYQTEIRSYPHPRSAEYIRIMDIANGLKCGMNAAEEFVLLRKQVL